MTHDEMIEVIKAHKEGKKIQEKLNGASEWRDCSSRNFNFYAYNYRVKPEELTIYIIRNPLGVLFASLSNSWHDSKVVKEIKVEI